MFSRSVFLLRVQIAGVFFLFPCFFFLFGVPVYSSSFDLCSDFLPYILVLFVCLCSPLFSRPVTSLSLTLSIFFYLFFFLVKLSRVFIIIIFFFNRWFCFIHIAWFVSRLSVLYFILYCSSIVCCSHVSVRGCLCPSVFRGCMSVLSIGQLFKIHSINYYLFTVFLLHFLPICFCRSIILRPRILNFMFALFGVFIAGG